MTIRTMFNRIGRALTAIVGGWSYDRWDPPYPGDGI